MSCLHLFLVLLLMIKLYVVTKCSSQFQQLQDSFDAAQDEVEQEKRNSKQARSDLEALITQLNEVKTNAQQDKEDKVKVEKLMEELAEDGKVTTLPRRSDLASKYLRLAQLEQTQGFFRLDSVQFGSPI